MKVDVRKLTGFGVLLTSVAVLLLAANPATGTITVTGEVTPAYTGSPDPWNIAGDLKVGNTGAASVTLSGNSKVVDVNAYMGYLAGSTANVLISDSTSLWQNSAGLYIGGGRTQAGGTAQLTITLGRVEAAQAIIWGGGSLLGTGTLKAATVTNWGTISPGGSSIGTLTLEGNVTFRPASILEVQVDNSGNSDKLVVTGDANAVGGTVKAISTETITGAKRYTIVEANSVTGQFSALDTALLHVAIADANESLGYTDKSVLLMITPYRFDVGIGQTPNERAMGATLQEIADAGGTAITGALQQLPTRNDVRAAYDQLSGQSRPPLAPVLATDTAKFMGIVSDRVQSARGAVARDVRSLSDGPLLAMAGSDNGIESPTARSWDGFLWDMGQGTTRQNWGTWGKVYDLFGDRKTKNGVTGYSYNVLGESVGVEFQMSERFIGGATGGYSSGNVDYDTLADKADVTTIHAGLYSAYSGDGWYASSMVTHSWIDVQTDRVVNLTGERPEGDFGGSEWSAYIEAGLDWEPFTGWLVQPLTAFQYTRLSLQQYAETGGLSALDFENQLYQSYKGSVGAKVTTELPLGNGGLAALVQARGRWVHEFGDVVSSVEGHFVDVPLVSFTVKDEATSRDSIVLGAGAGIRLTRGLRLFVDYDTSFNADKTVQVVSGALDYRW